MVEVTKFYVRHREGYPETEMQDYARRGFAELGVETVPFEWVDDLNEFKDLGPTVGVAGYITDVLRGLVLAGAPIPKAYDYPEDLQDYLGRRVWLSTLGDIRRTPAELFIKPVVAKAFTGFVWNGDVVSRHRVVTIPDDEEVWVSDVVGFLAEYRCFVLNGEILDVRRYKGDWSLAPNKKTLLDAVHDWRSPAAYSLDWGITREGKTLLVEVNDGYALGHYGLKPVLYAKMMAARWYEMVVGARLCLI